MKAFSWLCSMFWLSTISIIFLTGFALYRVLRYVHGFEFFQSTSITMAILLILGATITWGWFSFQIGIFLVVLIGLLPGTVCFSIIFRFPKLIETIPGQWGTCGDSWFLGSGFTLIGLFFFVEITGGFLKWTSKLKQNLNLADKQAVTSRIFFYNSILFFTGTLIGICFLYLIEMIPSAGIISGFVFAAASGGLLLIWLFRCVKT